MAHLFPANIDRLKGLGLEVLWKADHFQVPPVQTALWIRDAYAALWHQFSSNEAGEILGKNGIGMTAIFKYLRRRFPAFYETAVSADDDFADDGELEAGHSDKRIFSLLCAFGDFSHIGFGRYIPRETRLIQIAPDWARIAGALNIQAGELPDESGTNLVARTLGRVFAVSNHLDLWSHSELSPLMAKKDRLRTLNEWVAPLISSVTEKPHFDLGEASFLTTKQTGRRTLVVWEEAPHHTGLCLCKLNKSNYLLAQLSPGGSTSSAYCEVDGNERKLLEHYFRQLWSVGTPANWKVGDGKVELQLKYSLPKSFETELLAASASFQSDPDGVWIKSFSFPDAASPFVVDILSTLGIKTLP